jgi:excisionase family DNA binding protein
MPKPYKLFSTRRLPTDAELIEHDGAPHVRIKDRSKSILCRLTKDGANYLRPSKRWYFDLRDTNGTVRRIKGFADLKATEQLAAEMERKADRRRSGYTDPAEEHIRRPLVDHLADYAAHLEAKGGTPSHIRQTSGRITAFLTGCRFVFPLDADAGKAAEWLNALRRDGAPVELPPGSEAFRPSEAAALLGISKTALARALHRNNLPATGKGKARRLPRATVETLAVAAARGVGPATVNHYVVAVRGFFRWLVKAKRIGSNPLESLSLLNAAVDVRRARRELTTEELGRLFVAARESHRTFRGLTGTDRFHLYLVATGTGFRANALANLTPADFDLNALTVTLAARLNKSRRTKVQPLPADVANALRDFMAGKPLNVPLWGGSWASGCTGAEMLRIDLEAAGIPYVVEGPDGPEYADFHSLRHSFLTLGGRSGIDLRTLQELAGHSDPKLTARYSHRRLYDLAGAVDKLPNLVPDVSNVAAVPLRLTGTDAGAGVVPGVVPGVVTGGIGGHLSAPKYTLGIVGGMLDGSRESLEMQGIGAQNHQTASTRTSGASRIRTGNQGIMSPLL